MAAACYFYSEATPIRPLIHQLKYDHRDDIGLALGRYYGAQLAASSLVTAAPLLVPIPLHPSKRRKRGFNQAARIAAGIATTTGLELRQDLLLRQTATPSQTKVAPEQRWANVKDIFTVPKPLPARPLILVDDVITTGATMGSALRTLATARAQELRVLGIASAEGR
jgi:ComF family protein